MIIFTQKRKKSPFFVAKGINILLYLDNKRDKIIMQKNIKNLHGGRYENNIRTFNKGFRKQESQN